MKKILVAYFSATGVTAKLAQRLAQSIHADMYGIRPQTPYTTADLNWTDRTSRSSTEMRNPDCRPPLANPIPDVSNYDVVFLGFPVWWYREPSIIDTFMESCKWNGQVVIPFATSGGSGLGETGARLQKVAPKAKVKAGARFAANVAESELASWTKEVL